MDVYFDDFRVEHIKSPVVSSQDYFPFGLAFNEYSRENSLPNPYQFGGKEKQDELNINWLDFGARMYMSDIGRWGVIDPLGEKKAWLTLYQYCSNDPIRRIDPDGKDDYTVDKKGNVTLLKATKDDNDRLIALGKSGQLNYNKKGELKNKTHTLDKGILSSKQTQESRKNPDAMTNEQQVSRDTYDIKGESVDKSVGLFKFLAKNTSVEWSLTKGIDAAGNKLGVISTSHEENRVAGARDVIHSYINNKAFIPYANYHNHPDGGSRPSGIAGDLGFASQIKEKIPITRFYLFTSTPQGGDKMTEY